MFNGVSCYRYHFHIIEKKETIDRSQPEAKIDSQLSKELCNFDSDFYLNVPGATVSNVDFR